MRRRKVLLLFLLGSSASTEYDPEAKVESARLYGNLNEYAYYFTDILVGSPKQLTSVIVDTGSHIVGFPCAGCDHCGHHLEPAVNISNSKTARWLGCSDRCKFCEQDGRCAYSEEYSEGSSISGHWFEDYLQLGDASTENPAVRARMGCHDSENKLFFSQRADGIMGLAPSGDISEGSNQAVPSDKMPTVLDDLFKDRKHVDARIFSICLAEWGGLLTVGGYNQQHHLQKDGSGIKWIPMRAQRYYFVFPEVLKLEDSVVALDPDEFGVTIVDTGTTLTYFPEVVYNTLVSDLQSYCAGHAGCSATQESSGEDICWRLHDPDAKPTGFPTLSIKFVDVDSKVDWSPHSYLNHRPDNLWCYGFSHHANTQTILGISWLLHKDAIFDMKQMTFGLAEANCPEYRQVPGLWERFAGRLVKLGLVNRWPSALAVAALAVALAAVAVRFALRRTSRSEPEMELLYREQTLE